MINKEFLLEQINKIQEETNFNLQTIEKDYYISLFFKELEKYNYDKLIFKWWTCLNKIYFWFYRLSEDIDFSLNLEEYWDIYSLSLSQQRKIRDKEQKATKEIIDKCFEAIGCTELKKLDRTWMYRYKFNEWKMVKLYYEYDSLFSWKGLIQVEISARKPVYNPKKFPLKHLYYNNWFNILWKDILVNSYNIYEVFAEKIRCSFWRRKVENEQIVVKVAIRDLYDIFYWFTKADLKPFWINNKTEFLKDEIFLKLFLDKNMVDYFEWARSKDISFEEDRKYIKDRVLEQGSDLSIVLQDVWIKEFFDKGLDIWLDIVKEAQINLKNYINAKYKLNLPINNHIEVFLEKLSKFEEFN